MWARSGDAVKNGEVETVARPSRDVRVAALENELQAVELRAAVAPHADRLLHDMEPPRIVPAPIDVLQRHAYNVGITAAGAAPQQLLGKRIATDAFAPVLCFASQHF